MVQLGSKQDTLLLYVAHDNDSMIALAVKTCDVVSADFQTKNKMYAAFVG